MFANQYFNVAWFMQMQYLLCHKMEKALEITYFLIVYWIRSNTYLIFRYYITTLQFVEQVVFIYFTRIAGY